MAEKRTQSFTDDSKKKGKREKNYLKIQKKYKQVTRVYTKIIEYE